MGDIEEVSEQRIIENYLVEYRIEDCIDEIINHIIIDRPINPYLAIANAFEAKTLPEVLDVHFSNLSFYGSYGVKASIITNVGTFSGSTAYSVDASTAILEPKDFTVLNGKFKDALMAVNPMNYKQMEDAIIAIPEIDSADSLALCVAALRASAKFKNVKLYELIAELGGVKDDQVCIPMPVPLIATMNVPTTKAIKSVQLYPIKASRFDFAVTRLNQLFNKVLYHEKTSKPIRFSPLGTPWVESPTFEDLSKLFLTILTDIEENNNIKLGLNHHGDQCLKQPADPAAPAQQYLNSQAQVKTGPELIEQLMTSWGELDCLSVDNIVAPMDINSLRQLKKRSAEVIFEARNGNNPEKLKYCSKGIGGDAGCNLQFPMDGQFLLTVSIQDMEKQLLELPFNAVKINFSTINCVSKAIEICGRARQLNLPIIIDTVSSVIRNQYSSIDTFDADFAVGAGAVQFLGNGLYDTNFNLKLSRLQEISNENDGIPYVGWKFRSGPQS